MGARARQIQAEVRGALLAIAEMLQERGPNRTATVVGDNPVADTALERPHSTISSSLGGIDSRVAYVSMPARLPLHRCRMVA